MAIHLIKTVQDKDARIIAYCGVGGVPGKKGFQAVLATDPKQATTCPACRRKANSVKTKVSAYTR